MVSRGFRCYGPGVAVLKEKGAHLLPSLSVDGEEGGVVPSPKHGAPCLAGVAGTAESGSDSEE